MNVSDKKYQVFISSTYTDLKEERAKVTEAVLELGHMPYGMEVFPAANESQWEWIKKAIDESDYYIVIVGGRYGSIKPDTGLSYTEMEYRYATEKGIPSIAFIVDDSVDLKTSKAESDPDKKQKLDAFKRYISGSKLWKSYTSPDDLKAKVYPSLLALIRTCPREGWIRAGRLNDYTSYSEVLKIVQENDALKASKEDLACGNDIFILRYSLIKKDFISEDILYSGEFATTWDELFRCIAKQLYEKPYSIPYNQEWGYNHIFSELKHLIDKKNGLLLEKYKPKNSDSILIQYYIKIEETELDTIMIQFEALGLIEYKDNSYSLTAKGKSRYLQIVALKKK